ncbi:MAG TPA: alpha-L-arabinofuranosidase C-terminal domain-containing protein [Pyrinomonadaceae bacterium]|nr:alpha-L-arabinofuranosidase C-terminal domain-containing protein [Pyrinomonadaceae bacterium]
MNHAAEVGRRQFLGGALAAASGVLLHARGGQGVAAKIEVLPDETIGTINPDIYGHFVEHLGGVVYDGIWVGEGSKIPNTNGVRAALVEHLRRAAPSVIRYPGGCFADSYDWRDGVGPRARRPRRTNFWGPVESNQFGTNEFVRFCKLVGAQPYLAANLRGLPAQSFYEWVDYCNSPAGATSLGELRAAGEAGSREPFGVRFWGVGNESWGCGGNFTPDEYAMEFRRYTAAVPGYAMSLRYIAAGPGSGDLAWTRGFFAKMAEKGAASFNSLYGWGLHHYSWNASRGTSHDWDAAKGDAVNFNLEEWYELLREADHVDRHMREHWAAMGEFDREHRTKLCVDEWGAWYRPGTEVHPTHQLGQMPTLRDALITGITLDAFNRHADKVVMGNVAQLVNCLHALFLAHEERFVTTPVFHVFEMYAAHQGARSVRAVFDAPEVGVTRLGKPATFWGLNGSASLRDRVLTLTVVNPHASEPREAEITVRGAQVRAAEARVVTARDLRAHNTFAEPGRVVARDEEVRGAGGRASLVHRFAPASVTRLRLSL